MIFGKKSGVTRLVVFLGNPGPKYDGTRHNAGFMTCDALAGKLGVSVKRARFRALTATCDIGGESVMLMKPQTYMNNSGEAVAEAVRFYKLTAEQVIVVSDEVSLPIGRLRIRQKGSAGGHNGLKSIISCLGSDGFARIRLGVGAPSHPDYDMADWVLSAFRGKDADDMAEAAVRAAEAVVCYITEGPERAMNRFNTK